MEHEDTHHKALTVNLDPNIYGTLAEIGAGQEVARCFLQAGGASGTVAQTISAYDMVFSDAIYGKVGRYVSRERLLSMLDHEYALLVDRLAATRGEDTRLFVFADTVSARNFAGTNECHGWIGIRFQSEPRGEPNDLILHVNLMDPSNLLQQQAVGVLGVNLIHAVYFRRRPFADLLAAVYEGLSLGRVEIDLIGVRGAAFADVDERAAMLELVRGGFAAAVAFAGDGRHLPASELLRKHPLVIDPGVFAEVVPGQQATLERARLRLAAELGEVERPPLALFALTLRRPLDDALVPAEMLQQRLEALLALGSPVLVCREPEVYTIVDQALRYTAASVRLTVSALALTQLFRATHYTHLPGQLMEGLARLFADNVQVYVHPAPRPPAAALDAAVAGWFGSIAEGGDITLPALTPPSPESHLFRYLIESGFLQPL